MNNCSKTSKFIEANLAKKKLEEFKKLENKKVNDELILNFNLNKQNLESQYKVDLHILNETHDKILNDFKLDIIKQEDIFKDNHDIEIKKAKEELNKTISETPKPSSNIVNMKRILDKALKLKK